MLLQPAATVAHLVALFFVDLGCESSVSNSASLTNTDIQRALYLYQSRRHRSEPGRPGASCRPVFRSRHRSAKPRSHDHHSHCPIVPPETIQKRLLFWNSQDLFQVRRQSGVPSLLLLPLPLPLPPARRIKGLSTHHNRKHECHSEAQIHLPAARDRQPPFLPLHGRFRPLYRKPTTSRCEREQRRPSARIIDIPRRFLARVLENG
jgi:hypothetical protein